MKAEIKETPRLAFERFLLSVVKVFGNSKRKDARLAARELEKEFAQRVHKLDAKLKRQKRA